ncbi:MAG TPA: hypothetical protein VLA21_03895 [Candidatus Limnocylindria bacterium]|nr:hypothetical protein [Candidatus Limnocylindria bacterium]
MRKKWAALLFFGAAWGVCEATLGFVLHRMAVALPGLPGALMFPIGYFWMRRAQKATGNGWAALSAAAVAASAKLADFLVPGADPVRVVGPALSILLEGLAVAALYAQDGAGKRLPVFRWFSMGVLWRTLFALYLYIISLFDFPAALVTNGLPTLLRFVLLESALNAAVIAAGVLAASRLPRFRAMPVKPAAAWAACLLAIVAHAAL